MLPKHILVSLLILFGVGALTYSRKPTTQLNLPSQSTSNVSNSPFPVTHYRQADVQEGISNYPPLNPNKDLPRVIGGVVAHHLLASNNISRYFQNLGLSNYKTVVIIGPNHGELGTSDLVTSRESWSTPYGYVDSDSDLVNFLIKDEVAVEDNDILKADHAIEVIIPFVRTYLPGAKVVPLLVSANTTSTEADKLVSSLINHNNPDTMYLVSSDFSHYLMPSVAQKKDEETLALINTWQIDRISRLGNDHLDSGASVAILLRLMQKINSTNLKVFDHTDGSTIAGQLSTPTTTYYFLNYYEN